jgi:hypothetical protein
MIIIKRAKVLAVLALALTLPFAAYAKTPRPQHNPQRQATNKVRPDTGWRTTKSGRHFKIHS